MANGAVDDMPFNLRYLKPFEIPDGFGRRLDATAFFQAKTDNEAIQRARWLSNFHQRKGFELWQGDRLVQREVLEPTRRGETS